MRTIRFVTYGNSLYAYRIHIKGAGEAPGERLSRDWPLRINIFLWLVTGSSVLMWARLTN